MLAFDVSDSVAGTRLGQLRSASDVLLDELHEGDRVGLVTFNHNVRLRAGLTPDRRGIRTALEAMQASGGTATRVAMVALFLSRRQKSSATASG